jgi:hypothetical protein
MGTARSASSRRASVLAVGLAVTLGAGLSACTSTSGPDGAATSTNAPATTAPPTTQDVVADVQVAEEALLTLDEIPGGPWTEGDPRTSTTSSDFDCPELAQEAEFFNENASDSPDAKSPDYRHGITGAALQLDVNVVASTEVADRVSAFFADPGFGTCLEHRTGDQADTQAPNGVTVADLTVEPVDLPPVGDASSAWAMSFEMARSGQTATAHGTLVIVQVGRGFTLVSLIGEQPSTEDELVPIATAAADKLASTLEP